MNSVPELLTARRVIDIVPLIVIVCHVGVIDSLDDCNRRSSFKDPFSAVDANSNAILSFRCIYEYRSLSRGNIDPGSLRYRDRDSSVQYYAILISRTPSGLCTWRF